MDKAYYENCRLCPRNCGVNRNLQKGVCGCGSTLKAARAGLHYYEEPFLSGINGSGTVFFTGCSLRCIYCQNGQISLDQYGFEISAERLAEIFLEQQDRKAHNINLVTGTHFTPSIAKALSLAKSNGLQIPVVWNSSGYEKPEVLEILDGLVDIFMPDFKTLSSELGLKYMKAPDYPEWAKKSLDFMVKSIGPAVFEETPESAVLMESDAQPYEGENEMMRRGVIVRHLVIPGQSEDSKAILKYLFETYGDKIWISLMSQYTPFGKFQKAEEADTKYRELYHKLSRKEYDELVDYAIDLGIEQCMIQEEDVASESFIPVFDGTGIIK